MARHDREIERREKVEESRRATERILAQQEAEVKARKVRVQKDPAAPAGCRLSQ